MKQLSVLRGILWQQRVGIFLCIIGALFFLSTQASAAPYAYITIYGGNTVRVVDTADNSIGDTIIVGMQPHGIAVNPLGTRVYVGNWTDNTLSVIDTSDNSVAATVAVGLQPYGVAVSPNEGRVYVTNRQGNSVSVLETAGNTVERTITVGTNPRGVVVHPDNSRAYVTNFGVLANTGVSEEGGDISILDPDDTEPGGVIGTITTLDPADHPRGIAIHPDGSRIYVSNYRGTENLSINSNVKEIETATNTVTRTWDVQREPNGLAINPFATRIYVANSESSSVSVIDMAGDVITNVAVSNRPIGVSVTPDGEKIFVTLAGNVGSPGSSVAVIDAATNTVDETFFVGAGPLSFGQFIIGSSDETFSIGGSVSGLAEGNTVVLQNKDGDDYAISQNGGFSFRTGLADLSSYAVTVLTEPTSPEQTCAVTGGSGSDGSGILAGADVTDILVTCSTVTYTVTPSVGVNGSIAPSDPQTIAGGQTTAFTVTPDSGYAAVVGGTCGGSLVGTTYTTNAITADCTVVASFSQTTHTVTPSAGANGSIAPSTPQIIAEGQTTSFTVTPDSGYAAVVGGTCGGNLVGTTFTTNAIMADCTVVASFSQITHTVTPSAGANGSIAPSSPQTVAEGQTTAFTVTPDSGYTAVVGGTCGGSLVGTTFTTNAIMADCTVVASFSQITHTVTPSAGANGSISPSTPQTIAEGQTTSFTVTPASGYTAAVGGTCGGSLVGTTYTTNAITADCTVVASFSQNTYTVGGTVTGLDVGKEVILSNNGIDDLTVDGDGPFTFATPIADGSSYDVTVSTQPVGQFCTVGNGTGTVNGNNVTGVAIICGQGSEAFFWPMFLPATTGESNQ